MTRLIYILFIKLLSVGAKIFSPINQKAELWIKGRKNILKKIEAAVAGDTSKKVWMHCASLGEYEQGYPLLEKLKEVYPACKIVLTFFSPSGYEVQKHSKKADYIFYLPPDSQKNAEKFMNFIQPRFIIFIKYDYWYFYLREAHKRDIPLILASGNFLPGYSFFRWYGRMFREMLLYFTHLFVQNQSSFQLLQSINITNVSISGDTRFDRVLQVAEQKTSYSEVEQFVGTRKVVVAGSTWLDDDKELRHVVSSQPEIRFIIAPHHIGGTRLKECRRLYDQSILYSEYKLTLESREDASSHINTLIIDNIGMLKFLYRYADVCYVGGGFGDGIHNILEAAVFYKPILFGPKYKNFAEAIELLERGGAFNVLNALELETRIKTLLSNNQLYRDVCKISGDYVRDNSGATNTILNYIEHKISF